MLYEKYAEISHIDNVFDEISNWVDREFSKRYPSKRMEVSTTTVKVMQDDRIITIPLKLHQYDYQITKEDAQELNLFYIRDLFMSTALEMLCAKINELKKTLETGRFAFNMQKNNSSFIDWFIRRLDIILIENNRDFSNLFWSNNVYPILRKHLRNKDDRTKLIKWYVERYCNKKHE